MAAGPALAAAVRARGGRASAGLDVVELVRAGNADAIAVVRQAGRDIGGQLSAAGEHLLAG